MATIDADAHVLESERTWEYMTEAERELRPRIVPTPDDADSGGECWLIDGRLLGKARNVGPETPKGSREMEDIESRLRHMDELGVDIQVLYPTVAGRRSSWRSPGATIAGWRISGSALRNGFDGSPFCRS